jgi:hypothetical protein
MGFANVKLRPAIRIYTSLISYAIHFLFRTLFSPAIYGGVLLAFILTADFINFTYFLLGLP